MSPRSVLCALWLLALAGLGAAWGHTALLWDGAYQLCCTLNSGRPFIYLSRFHSWLVWWPVAWLAPRTGNLRLLELAFSLPFCLAPLAGAALSWWVVRRSAPHLMVWALFGIALAPLPGQIFTINDSIFQLHLFWPVFLGALLPVTPAQRGTLALLSLFQLSHPLGIGLCLLAAGAALICRRPGSAAWLTGLAVVGAWKLVQWPDLYAAREASFGQVHNTFVGGVRGWPLTGVAGLWLAAAALAWLGYRPASRFGKALGPCALALLALVGAAWMWWALHPALWEGALGYRRWAAAAALPVLLAATWEIRRGGPVQAKFRGRAGVLAASIFFLVLSVQSLHTNELFRRLAEQIGNRPSGLMPAGDLAWTHGTALDHWGLDAQVILLQGRHPSVYLGNAEGAAAATMVPPCIALSPFNFLVPADYPQSWFSWRPPSSDGTLPPRSQPPGAGLLP